MAKPVQLIALLLFFMTLGPTLTWASDREVGLKKPWLIAQAEDESYDPFADYSEFDEANDEEADVHFFRHGRFFVLGFLAGSRGFTETLASLYSPGPTYGLFMTFFFDFRFALQAGFSTGDHAYELSSTAGKTTGNISMTFLDVALKIYMNTQNVTRGLADLNPYFIGGFSQVYRTLVLTGTSDSARDATMGLLGGAGIEIPLMRKKAFFGVQGTYRYFNFKDENQFAVDSLQQVTSTKPRGDSFDVVGILGLNF